METQSTSKGTVRQFDPKKSGKYKIKLGDLSRHNKENPSFISVASDRKSQYQVNHKPSQTGSTRETTISQAQTPEHDLELRIEDITGDGPMDYSYQGKKTSPENAYVLTFDQDQQSVQIDSLSSAYTFNMVSAPWEKHVENLRQQYSQIDSHLEQASSSEKPTSGSEVEDVAAAVESDGPDDDNPFDYRHYLNGIPGAQPESKVPSLAATPLHMPKAGSVSPRPLSRLNGTSPMPKPTPVVAPKKQNRAQPANKRQQNKVYKSAEKVIDSDASDDNDGLLIIDSGPTPPAKKRRTVQQARSLHAAAAAAQTSREPPPAERDAGSGYEEDDESDEPKEAPLQAEKNTTSSLSAKKQSRADDDDVEEFKLPAPVKSRPAPPIRRQSMWESGDEEELEAALEAELEAGDDNDDDQQPLTERNTSQNRAQESESESEEE